MYGRRADVESANRQLEDALWQKRAGSYGRDRVLADTLAWALGQNAIAAFIHRRDLASPPGEAIAA